MPIGIDAVKAGSSYNIGEMEEGLETISAELASSIRREMELEDLVERLQTEVDNRRGQDNRTSDYFSDSGTSSDTNTATEDIERLQRKTNREKAQIRLDCQKKVQEHSERRSRLEEKIRRLEEKVTHVDPVRVNLLDNGGRMKGLETTCEDLRRRLNDERNIKDNFEELLRALSSELHTSHNEHDNLRDEVIPQLRARVEGLEAQAAEYKKLVYEHTKMQHQMQSSRNDVDHKPQTDVQHHMDSLGEDGSYYLSLKRSKHSATPLGPRTISKSLDKGVESQETLLRRVRDVEAQRDALHCALKSLLVRQVHQTREYNKWLRQMEMGRYYASGAKFMMSWNSPYTHFAT